MKGRVFVIGLGLIGGSLALCIKNKHEESVIIGYDINEDQAKLARALGVVDEFVRTIPEGAVEADVIIISAPVNETQTIMSQMTDLPLKKEVIVTDTGSTKQKISQHAQCLLNKGVCFIGGHPMAGSHKSGVTAAKDFLFENAFYLLTPDNRIPEEKIELLKTWLKGTNAKFITIAPDEHDFLTGVVSHFPHIIAASIVRQTEKLAQSRSLIPRLAAGGFRDITRIASSSPEMWRDVLLQNKEVLLSLLSMWHEEMDWIKQTLEEEDSSAILNYFKEAKQYRDALPIKEKGAIPAFYDLFVDIPDYPGVISEITGYLAKENISITNIRILETREEIYGVLVISFQTEEDRQRAENCIQAYTDYATFIVS